MTLRARLFLLVLLAVLPAIAIQFYTEFDLRRTREAEIEDQALSQAHVVTASMSEILEGSRQLLVALAQLPVVQALDSRRCGEALATMMSELPNYDAIGVASRDGRLVCSGIGTAADQITVSDRTYFRDALLTGGFVIGRFAVGRTTGTKLLHVALPIVRDEETVGVLIAGIDLERLKRHFLRRLPPGSVLLITDRDGTILVNLPGQRGVGQQLPAAHRPYILGDQSRTVALTDLDGVERVFAYVPMNYPPAGAVVAVGLDKHAALAPVEAATVRGIALILVGLLLGFVGAWLVGRHFVQHPVGALLEATRRWHQGDYTARAQLGEDPSEIAQLGRAFDEMAERLQEQLRQKDMLLREVNHRIMNSLQLLSSVLALQRRRIVDAAARDQFEEARRRIQSVALVHRRLYRGDGAETVNFGQFLQELCTEIARSFSPARAGPTEVHVECVSVQLGTDKVIPLALIIFELLTNAFKYARPAAGGRALQVWCRLTPDGKLAVTVADNGPGLPPDFEQRAGLGMKLVQTLLGQVRGTLSHSSDASGTRFTVLVPVEPTPAAKAAEKSGP